jgi:deoxyinosine 3'endonuclease (endonuclease V)
MDLFAAVDVQYLDTGGARAAAVLANEPTFATIAAEHVAGLATVADYQPGAFYLRELPAIEAVLALAPAGMSTVEAAQLVRELAGPHRIPTALKRVDALARGR